MGVNTSIGIQGAGQATLSQITGGVIGWIGLESPPAATITSGFSGTAGDHIVYIDFGQLVDIEVNSADTIRIHNGATAGRTGTVTLIW